jgi:hypothetical protein
MNFSKSFTKFRNARRLYLQVPYMKFHTKKSRNMASAGRRSVVEVLKRKLAEDLWEERVCLTAQLL